MIVIVHGQFVVDWTDLQLSIAGAILLAGLLVDLMTKVLLKLWFVVAIVAMKAKAEALTAVSLLQRLEMSMLVWKTPLHGWMCVFAELTTVMFGRFSMAAAYVEKKFAARFEIYAEKIAATVPLEMVLRVVIMKVMLLVMEIQVLLGKMSVTAVVVETMPLV